MTLLTRDYPRPGIRLGWLLCPATCPPGSLSNPYFTEQKDVLGSSSIFPALETSHFFGEDQIIVGGNGNKNRLLDGLIATKTLLLWGFLSGQVWGACICLSLRVHMHARGRLAPDLFLYRHRCVCMDDDNKSSTDWEFMVKPQVPNLGQIHLNSPAPVHMRNNPPWPWDLGARHLQCVCSTAHPYAVLTAHAH